MNGQQVGYIRVSTVEQHTDRQLDGVTLDKIYEDKCSGKDTNRPALKACLAYLREGDTLHVHEMSRLGRNGRDLEDIVNDLHSRGVTIVFHAEGLTISGEGTMSSTTKLMFDMFRAFAQFERNLLKERQAEGIAKAKAAGRYKGGTEKLNAEQVAELSRRKALGVTVSQLSRDFKISRQSVYRYLEKAEQASSQPA